MNRAVVNTAILVVIAIANLFAAVGFVGYGPTYEVAYGFVTLMAAFISLTFVKLYHNSRRDIGLAMVVSWAGTSGVQGWWWIFSVLNRPEFMRDYEAFLMVPLGFYVIGTLLHVKGFYREMSGREFHFLLPAVVAFTIALALNLFV